MEAIMLTESQKTILKNLSESKEIYYYPDSYDIQFLIKNGYLRQTGNGEYIVLKTE